MKYFRWIGKQSVYSLGKSLWLKLGKLYWNGQGREIAMVWVRISGGLSRRVQEEGKKKTYLRKYKFIYRND